MKDHNARLKQWEGDVTRAPWTIGTFIGAVIWSIVSLGVTLFFSFFALAYWSLEVSANNSANTSGEAKRGLTRADVLQSLVLGAWWPLVVIVVLSVGIWILTKEIFGVSGRNSSRFAWILAITCALIPFGIWMALSFNIWRQYAPLSR